MSGLPAFIRQRGGDGASRAAATAVDALLEALDDDEVGFSPCTAQIVVSRANASHRCGQVRKGCDRSISSMLRFELVCNACNNHIQKRAYACRERSLPRPLRH